MGVRYWEVWNEPNIFSFWQAPYPDYLKLYDVTAERPSADPSSQDRRPSVSYFSTDHIGEFLEHERWNVLGNLPAHVDFISWHSYGSSPEEVAADIRHIRKILEDFPSSTRRSSSPNSTYCRAAQAIPAQAARPTQ